MWLRELASLESVGKAGRLETQVVDVVVLSLKSIEQARREKLMLPQSWGRISSLGNLIFTLKTFKQLDEAHPYYQR